MPAHYRVFAAFFIYALTLGGIYPRLGDLQLEMGIAEGALGAALMGFALGTQVSLMFAGPLIEKVGYRLSLIIGIPLLGIGEALATLAPGPLALFLVLTLAGLAIGVIEIVINVEADRTEHRIGRRIMNRAHAFWSFGFFGAGLLGGIVKQAGVDANLHLWVLAAVTGVATFFVCRNFEPAGARVANEGPRPRFVMPNMGIMALVGLTLSAMLLEGAGIDWSVIFMRDVYDTTPFLNSMALALGALMQALVRFFADGFVDRFGPIRVGRTLVATLGAGVLMVTFSVHPAMALAGFALMGAGTSAIFPLAMSAAAQRTDRPAATNVAALAQLSFVTFLVAPPALGFIAEHFGIRMSFGVGIPLVALSWFLVHTLAPGHRRRGAAHA